MRQSIIVKAYLPSFSSLLVSSKSNKVSSMNWPHSAKIVVCNVFHICVTFHVSFSKFKKIKNRVHAKLWVKKVQKLNKITKSRAKLFGFCVKEILPRTSSPTSGSHCCRWSECGTLGRQHWWLRRGLTFLFPRRRCPSSLDLWLLRRGCEGRPVGDKSSIRLGVIEVLFYVCYLEGIDVYSFVWYVYFTWCKSKGGASYVNYQSSPNHRKYFWESNNFVRNIRGAPSITVAFQLVKKSLTF